MTQKDTLQLRYDPLNRLREAKCGTLTVRFLYDPLGRRLSKTVLEGNFATHYERYLYHGQHEVGAIERDGTLRSFRVLGLSILEKCPTTVAIELHGEVFVPQADVHGNICTLVNFDEEMISQYDYTSFGEERRVNPDINPWRYASKRFDPELGLVYFGKRYYDPANGRWLSTDPAGFLDSLNLYQYAYNNPYSYYDPNGEFLFLAYIPFALLFSSAAVKICVDAVVASVVGVGLYSGAKYVGGVLGSSSSFSETDYYEIIDRAAEQRYESLQVNRSTKKHQEKDFPGTPKDLEKNPDWKETTHPGEAKSGSRTFENKKTGEKLRYDKGKPGASGHEANDHYHRYNPNSKGKYDKYLDKDGNSTSKNSDASHLYPPEGNSWL